MYKRIVLAMFSLFAAGSLLAQAYKWTDEDGIVHYSDRPVPGAEEVQLVSSGTRRPTATRPVQTVFRANKDDAPEPEMFRYQSLTVVSPVAEETLWNIGGVLNVTLNVTPALQSGHRLNVYYDGVPIAVTTANFRIEEVYRGAHNLQAEILDKTGRLMIRSDSTRFYVQQTSIN
jgi:hypothetical protein